MSRPPSFRLHARTVLLCAGLAIPLAACGSAGSPAPSLAPPSGAPVASPGPSTGSAPALLLEVTSEGGFINPAATIGALPRVVADADGRIFTAASTPSSTTIPLVPPVEVRDVGVAGAALILEAIRSAGLDHEGSGGAIVPDAGSTVFTVVIDGRTIISRYNAAGGGPGGPGGIGGPGASDGADPGAGAFALLAQLIDPNVTWGAASVPETEYAPVGYRVFAAPGGPADVGSGGAPVPWPLGTGLAGFGTPAVPDLGITGLRSGIVIGSDAATLATALARTTAGTPFSSAGQAFTLWVRPLFPDELGG